MSWWSISHRKTLDIGDPVAASTMLQRFLHSDVTYAENELGPYPLSRL